MRRVRQVFQAEGLLFATHEDSQGRATVHLPRVRQTVPRLRRFDQASQGRAREAEEFHVRPLRQIIRVQGDAGGSPAHPYRRTAVRLRLVREDIQIQGVLVHPQQAAHRYIPARVLVLWQTVPPAAGGAGACDHAHRREESRVRRVREEVPGQVRARAAQAHSFREQAVRLRQVRSRVPAEALPEQSHQESAQGVPASVLTIRAQLIVEIHAERATSSSPSLVSLSLSI